MTSVWVTRSEPGSTALAEALSQHGYAPVKQPLLSVEPTFAPRPKGHFSTWVFLSVHAVACLGERVSPQDCIAVGPGTAAALRSRDIECTFPKTQCSEGVIELLASCLAESEPVLVVQGEGGRRLVQAWCRERFYPFETWAVYRRVSQCAPPECRDVSIIVCSSAETLPGVRLCIGQRVNQTPVVVPSERVKHEARSLGFGNVWVSDGSAPSAVLSTLSKIGLT